MAYVNHPPKGPFTLEELANLSDSSILRGDPQQEYDDVASLERATPREVACLNNGTYGAFLESSQAGVCVMASKDQAKAPPSMALLISERPHWAFIRMMQAFHPEDTPPPSQASSATIHPTARIGDGCILEDGVVIQAHAVLGKRCRIGPYAVVGKNVIMGDFCHLEAHVTLTHAVLGDYVFIKPGARIGQRGYGFFMDYKNIESSLDEPQLGRVIIGNHVEIGANTTIDRGSLNDTLIGDWARIDNQVQLGHNVHIGKGCILVAQVGVAGSTKIGDFSALGGQVGVAGHLSIAPYTRIAAKSGIMNHIKETGQVLAGIPAVLAPQWRRACVILRRLAKKEI